MAPRKPKDCRTMEEVRAEIDRIDQALVDLIGERFSYVDRAWQRSRACRRSLPRRCGGR
jgi:isochorismate pyruvate lyase